MIDHVIAVALIAIVPQLILSIASLVLAFRTHKIVNSRYDALVSKLEAALTVIEELKHSLRRAGERRARGPAHAVAPKG
jgi:type II secretory pathway component PulJ